MFQVFVVIALTALLVLLLYLWADVREISGTVKELKREFLRNQLSVRAAQSFPNFQEERRREQEEEKAAAEGAPGNRKTAAESRPLRPSEEQLLDEVLTEFLG